MNFSGMDKTHENARLLCKKVFEEIEFATDLEKKSVIWEVCYVSFLCQKRWIFLALRRERSGLEEEGNNLVACNHFKYLITVTSLNNHQ
jgi:hypothetical protein